MAQKCKKDNAEKCKKDNAEIKKAAYSCRWCHMPKTISFGLLITHFLYQNCPGLWPRSEPYNAQSPEVAQTNGLNAARLKPTCMSILGKRFGQCIRTPAWRTPEFEPLRKFGENSLCNFASLLKKA
jgi:hypothetical protein